MPEDERTDEITRANSQSVWQTADPPKNRRPPQAVLPNLRSQNPIRTDEVEIPPPDRSIFYATVALLVGFIITVICAVYVLT